MGGFVSYRTKFSALGRRDQLSKGNIRRNSHSGNPRNSHSGKVRIISTVLNGECSK